MLHPGPEKSWDLSLNPPNSPLLFTVTQAHLRIVITHVAVRHDLGQGLTLEPAPVRKSQEIRIR